MFFIFFLNALVASVVFVYSAFGSWKKYIFAFYCLFPIRNIDDQHRNVHSMCDINTLRILCSCNFNILRQFQTRHNRNALPHHYPIGTRSLTQFVLVCVLKCFLTTHTHSSTGFNLISLKCNAFDDTPWMSSSFRPNQKWS